MELYERDLLIAAASTIRTYCKYEKCDDCPFFIDLGQVCGKCALTNVSVPDEWEFPND